MYEKQKRYPRFEGYTGGSVWCVTHPEHGTIAVLAPSNVAAIVVAAKVWGEIWQKYDFYINTVVSFVGLKNKLKQSGAGAAI